MATKKAKFYVVWNGHRKGVFDNWNACKASVDSFPKAQYKSFETRIAAEMAFQEKPEKHIYKDAKKLGKVQSLNFSTTFIYPSMAVDAACSGLTGKMEYQGVDPKTKRHIFHKGPYKDGTNNVGEFLAIVHALALLHKTGSDLPIYSDSKIAIGWVKKKKHASTLSPTPNNEELFDLLERAEKWLKEHKYKNQVLKWETKWWGENPADFGNK